MELVLLPCLTINPPIQASIIHVENRTFVFCFLAFVLNSFSRSVATLTTNQVPIMSNENLFYTEALPQLDALRNFAYKLCRDEQYTNDLVQETMLKACRSFHTYQEGTNCRAWLFQICKNAYINDYRRKQYETVVLDFSEVPSDGEEDAGDMRHARVNLTDNHAGQSHDAMVGDEVADALNALPSDYQTALILSDIEGHTYEEIAEFTHAPIGTIRSRIHRARKMLAVRLEDYAASHGYGPSYFSLVQ